MGIDKELKDTLIWIEKHLPERFELLLRTNREYEDRIKIHKGRYFLHLLECVPNEDKSSLNEFLYKSWYKEYSDDLSYLINNVVAIVKNNF